MIKLRKILRYWPLLVVVSIGFGIYALFEWNKIFTIFAIMVLSLLCFLAIKAYYNNKYMEGIATMIGGIPCHLCNRNVETDAAQSRGAFQVKKAVERGLRPPEYLLREARKIGIKTSEASWCQQVNAMSHTYNWILCPYCARKIDIYASKKFWHIV